MYLKWFLQFSLIFPSRASRPEFSGYMHTYLFLIYQPLHRNFTSGRGGPGTMTRHLHMKACGRTVLTSHTTVHCEHEQKDKDQDRARDHQNLYVTRLFVEPSAET